MTAMARSRTRVAEDTGDYGGRTSAEEMRSDTLPLLATQDAMLTVAGEPLSPRAHSTMKLAVKLPLSPTATVGGQ